MSIYSTTIAAVCLVCCPYVVLSVERCASSDAAGIVKTFREKKVSLFCSEPMGVFEVLKFLCIRVKCDLYICIKDSIDVQEHPPLVETRYLSVNVTNVSGRLELTIAARDVSAWDLLNHVVERAGMSLEIRDFGIIVGLTLGQIDIRHPVEKIAELKVGYSLPPDVKRGNQMYTQAIATVSAQYPQLDLAGLVPEMLFCTGTTVVTFGESTNGATCKNAKERVRVVFDEKNKVVDIQLISNQTNQMWSGSGSNHKIK